MADDNVEFGKRWFEEVWNHKKGESVPEFLSADCVMHGISETGGDVRGPEGFLALHAKLLSAFPDMQFTLDDCFGAGDKIVVRWTATMRHTGPGLGIEATGAEIKLRGMGIARIADGKVQETWDNWDRMAMFEQIDAAVKAKSAGV
ncbi:MAG TPA: ester cyclase [Candidatus Sulfotelmatobacter sp.]|jgi:predicted ester cyclase|nr:ester cyclase [Candidatus Sulfotelmatobacter sp.]